MDGGPTLEIVQETRYPWDGAVRIAVAPDQAVCLGEAIHGSLLATRR